MLGCTIDEAQQRVTSSTFEEWKIYEAMEPTGELRMDFRFAKLTADLFNFFRDRDKGNAIGVEECLLKFIQQIDGQDEDQALERQKDIEEKLQSWLKTAQAVNSKG